MNPFTIIKVVALLVGLLLLVGTFLPLAKLAESIFKGQVTVTPVLAEAKGYINSSSHSYLEMPVRVVNRGELSFQEVRVTVYLKVGDELVALSSKEETVLPGDNKTITCSASVPRVSLSRLVAYGMTIASLSFEEKAYLTSVSVRVERENVTLIKPLVNVTSKDGALYLYYVNPTPITVNGTLHVMLTFENGTLREESSNFTMKRYSASYIPLAYGRVSSATVEILVGGEVVYSERWEKSG